MKGNFLALGPSGFGTYAVSGDDWQLTTSKPEGALSPGLVDLHIHGGFGIDWMTSSTEDIQRLANHLESEGYEAWLPTTVTASPEDVLQALDRTPKHRSIAGFHLEGPFISPDFAGAQPPHLIVDPPTGESAWDAVLNDPRLKVVTMAPERPHALALARRLSDRGIVVSMGHTNATFEEAKLGYESGFRQVTHTFNAMRPFHHREAAVTGFALTQVGLTTELIYDRLHVSRDAAGVLIRCKGPDDLIAVSDGTMAAGMPEGAELQMWGHDCIVGKGDVRLKSNGGLAGSAITLRTAFQNLWQDFGAELAIRACCHNPRRAIGLPSEPRTQLVWTMDGELKDRIEL